ncbi:MAG: hypothetical protein OXI10_06835, partial [Gammaproteobacteria bacterium]|nr:hypothetical protein [Gammaproteobacteria bacterium]
MSDTSSLCVTRIAEGGGFSTKIPARLRRQRSRQVADEPGASATWTMIRASLTSIGWKASHIPENHVGCALACAPYVTLPSGAFRNIARETDILE